MMTVGQNNQVVELGKVRSELQRIQTSIDGVNKTIEFAERFGFRHSIDTIHQPMKTRLIAEYASLVEKENELLKGK